MVSLFERLNGRIVTHQRQLEGITEYVRVRKLPLSFYQQMVRFYDVSMQARADRPCCRRVEYHAGKCICMCVALH